MGLNKDRANKISKRSINTGYKEYPCDLCMSNNAIEMPHVRKYTAGQVIHICKNCGFIYVKNRRAYDCIAQVWSKELFGKGYTSKTPLMLARHTYIAEFIDQNITLKNKKLCDIGAGEGQFLNIVKNNYHAQPFGIEPSSANCQKIRRSRIRCFQGTLEDYIASPESKGYKPDIMTMMWTLENATSCNNLLMGARQVLRDDGYLVVATGSRILVPFSKPLSLYLSSNPADTHPSRFSANTLAGLLRRNGFAIKHVNPYLNDALTLCIVAKKSRIRKKVNIKGDNYLEVRDFFRRWHKETLFYSKQL